MYQSKSSLRGSYTVFDRVRHEAPVDRLELETDLRSALRQNQMQAYYQPIVSLDGLQVLGFEALLRWLHPARGVIAPGVFIPLAEKCGTIGALSWWVMHEACRQTREWQLSDVRFADLTVSVNVSSRLLSEPHFAARTAAVLEKTGLAPHALHLELTEDVLLHHEREVINELQMLHRLGVKLHLDDFGTGYSSLAYLNRFDYDTIKIDRSFLAGGPQTSRNRRIVDAVISLAAVLGIDVIAEGVETPEQADNLRALNCRAAQGFLFSQPVPATAAGELLVRGHGVMSESSWHAVERHPNA
jgi:Amt family ammonium transporter